MKLYNNCAIATTKSSHFSELTQHHCLFRFQIKPPIRLAFFLLSAAIFLAGCAGTDTWMKTQTSTYFPYSIADQQTQFGIVVRAFDANGKVVHPASKNLDDSLLYLSVDVSPLLLDDKNWTQDRRNKFIDFLFMLSDHNCTLFLSRLYASNTNEQGIKGIVSTLFNAATASAAPFSVPAATALGATNVMVGAVSSDYENVYLAGKSNELIQNTILAARLKIKTQILNHKADAYDKYNIYQLIRDIGYYDAICSIRYAVRQLENNTQQTLTSNEKDAGTQPSDKSKVNPNAPPEAQAAAAAAGAKQ